jgi:hypothetical protein
MREYFPGAVGDLVEYGHHYLSPDEHKKMLGELLSLYRRTLAADLMSLKGREFLDFHRQRLAELGYPLTTSTLVKAGLAELASEVVNPQQLIAKVRQRLGKRTAKARS